MPNLMVTISHFEDLVTWCTCAGDTGNDKMATRFPLNTFIYTETDIWNQHPSPWSANMLGAARLVATMIAKELPTLDMPHWLTFYTCTNLMAVAETTTKSTLLFPEYEKLL